MMESLGNGVLALADSCRANVVQCGHDFMVMSIVLVFVVAAACSLLGLVIWTDIADMRKRGRGER